MQSFARRQQIGRRREARGRRRRRSTRGRCERSWTRRNRRRVACVQIDVLVEAEGPGPDEGNGGELEGLVLPRTKPTADEHHARAACGAVSACSLCEGLVPSQNGGHGEQSLLSRPWRHHPTYRRRSHLSVRGEASAVQSSVRERVVVSRHQPCRHEVRGGTLSLVQREPSCTS